MFVSEGNLLGRFSHVDIAFDRLEGQFRDVGGMLLYAFFRPSVQAHDDGKRPSLVLLGLRLKCWKLGNMFDGKSFD